MLHLLILSFVQRSILMLTYCIISANDPNLSLGNQQPFSSILGKDCTVLIVRLPVLYLHLVKNNDQTSHQNFNLLKSDFTTSFLHEIKSSNYMKISWAFELYNDLFKAQNFVENSLFLITIWHRFLIVLIHRTCFFLLIKLFHSLNATSNIFFSFVMRRE